MILHNYSQLQPERISYLRSADPALTIVFTKTSFVSESCWKNIPTPAKPAIHREKKRQREMEMARENERARERARARERKRKRARSRYSKKKIPLLSMHTHIHQHHTITHTTVLQHCMRLLPIQPQCTHNSLGAVIPLTSLSDMFLVTAKSLCADTGNPDVKLSKLCVHFA